MSAAPPDASKLFPWELDLRSLGLFRVLLACAALWHVGWRVADFGLWFAPGGLVDAASRAAIMGYPDLSGLGASPALPAALLALSALASVLLALGVRAQLMSGVLTVSMGLLFLHRPVMVATEGVLLLWALLWATFLPTGRALTVRRRARANGATVFSGAAALGLLLNVGASYFFNALSKTDPSWKSGEALGLILQGGMYTRPAGLWLAAQPSGLLAALTVGVLLFEAFVVFALLYPHARARLVAVLLLMAMHLGFAVFMSVGFYPAMSVVWLAALLPPLFWDRRWRRDPGAPSLRAPRPVNLLAGGVLAYVGLLLMVEHAGLLSPEGQARLRSVGIYQRWTNFTAPHYTAGHPVALARFADGSRADVYPLLVGGAAGAPVAEQRPDAPARYGNHGAMNALDWRRDAHRKFAERLHNAGSEAWPVATQPLAEHLCRRSGATELELLWVNYRTGEAEPMWRGRCPGV